MYGVPDGDERHERSVFVPVEGIPCGIWGRDGGAAPATHAEPREHDVVGVKAGWFVERSAGRVLDVGDGRADESDLVGVFEIEIRLCRAAARDALARAE